MATVTLKTVVNAVRDACIGDRSIAPKHLGINGFSFGNVSVINTLDIRGIHCHLQPTSTPVGDTTTSHTFNLYVFDVLTETNALDVLSDTLQVVQDFVKLMGSSDFRSAYGFAATPVADAVPFDGDFESHSAGWVVTMGAETGNGSTCQTGFRRWYEVAATGSTETVFYVDLDPSYGDVGNLFGVGDLIVLHYAGDTEVTRPVGKVSFVRSESTRISVTLPYAGDVEKIRARGK